MSYMSLSKLTSSILIIIASAGAATAREQIQIAGSSTVLPYAVIVAEAFGENFNFPTPVVESGGSSAGLKKFCEGVGTNTIDIANSSRKIKKSELKTCTKNGVRDIIEIRIGYDGIVFASDIGADTNAFTPSDWYLALSDKVLRGGEIVANTNKTWADVNPALPAVPIVAFIPGTKHGTREVFEDAIILTGCKATGAYDIFLANTVFLASAEGDGKKTRKKAAQKACIAVRTDGISVDIDGDYTETLARIKADKNGIGVFGLSFFENNTDKLRVATISGITPSADTIASGEYPVSRPLFFYVKKAHIGAVPGLKEYIVFSVSDEIAGGDGPLAAYGLVADPKLSETQETVFNEETM